MTSVRVLVSYMAAFEVLVGWEYMLALEVNTLGINIQMPLIRLDLFTSLDITESTVSSILTAQIPSQKDYNYDLKHQSIIIFNWL